MAKLSLDQFLRESSVPLSDKARLYLPEDIEFVDKAVFPLINALYEHTGMYEINGVLYDSVVFTGSDNIYFSYAFNPNSGNALAETLFILSSLQISKTSDMSYELIESTGVISVLTLRT